MPQTGPTSDAAMMTLCMFAYDRANVWPREPIDLHAMRIRAAIVKDLQRTDLPTDGQWTFAWGPGLTDANCVYAARERTTGQVAIVIRGTDPEIVQDWLEDLDILATVPFPFVPAADARIAQGTSDGLQDILGMTGAYYPASTSGAPVPRLTLLQFLQAETQARNAPLSITVTGHSLGGALASVLAPWIASQTKTWAPPPTLRCCTFAAPTAGNGAFAQATAPLYGSPSSRYFNAFDIVPRAWDDVASIAGLFPNGGPTCSKEFADLCIGTADVLKLYGYQQPTLGQSLPTPVAKGLTFEQEVLHQHASATYLAALTGQPVAPSVRVPVRAGTPKARSAAPSRT